MDNKLPTKSEATPLEAAVLTLVEKYWKPIDDELKPHVDYIKRFNIIKYSVIVIFGIIALVVPLLFYVDLTERIIMSIFSPLTVGTIIFSCFIPLELYLLRRRYKQILLADFSDINSRSRFIDVLIADVKRARYWWWLQDNVADLKKIVMYTNDDSRTTEKHRIICRTCKLTQIPPLEKVDIYKITLSPFVLKYQSTDIAEVKNALLSILPCISSKTQNFEEEFMEINSSHNSTV